MKSIITKKTFAALVLAYGSLAATVFAATEPLEFKSAPLVACFDTGEFCSVNINIKGLVKGTVDTILTVYPESEVSKNPSDSSKWQKGVVLPPSNTLAANDVAITPGGAIVLSSSATYAELKALPAKSGTTDTVFIPILSYKLKSGGTSGMATSGISAKGSERIDLSKIVIKTTPPPSEKVPSQAVCGAAGGGTFSTAPDNALCDSNSKASDVTPAPSSGWNWTCVIVPYAPVNCSASQSNSAPKGSDPIKTTTQGTGSGSVNLGGGKPDIGAQNDPNKKDDTTKKDDTAANPAKNYLQNPFKNLDTFPKIIKAVVNNIILPIAVPFIAIMIIYSGFLFVIAKKDGKVYSIDRAKNTLKNTLIGAGLILGAFVIANALQATLKALLK